MAGAIERLVLEADEKYPVILFPETPESSEKTKKVIPSSVADER